MKTQRNKPTAGIRRALRMEKQALLALANGELEELEIDNIDLSNFPLPFSSDDSALSEDNKNFYCH